MKNKFFVFVLFLLLIWNQGAAQPDYSKAKVELRNLSGNVYSIKLSMPINYQGKTIDWFVNLGAFIGNDGILLIDTGFEETFGIVISKLKKIGEGKIKYIVNTHHHQDHTGANETTGSNPSVIAHSFTGKKLIEKPDVSGNEEIQPDLEKAVPLITFEDSLSLYFNGEEIKLFHFEDCHTPGDILAYFPESKVLFAGDYLSIKSYPYMNYEECGDIESYAESVRSLINFLPDDVKIVPGHSEISGKEDLKKFYNMIVESTGIVHEWMVSGRKMEELKEVGLPAKLKTFETDFIDTKGWMDIVYNCLKEKKETGFLSYTDNQKYLFNIFKSRRTVRKFRKNPVPEEHIIKILDIARSCPTAGNQQPWKFLVIRDRDKLNDLQNKALFWYIEKYKKRFEPDEEKLKNINEIIGKSIKNALSAPVYVAVLVNKKSKYSDYIIYDGSLAAGYLMIAARALGYGTGFFTTYFPDKEMKEFFDIPAQYKLICFTPIGVPEEWPEIPPKKNIDDLIIFETFK